LTAIGTRVEERADAVVNGSERALSRMVGSDARPPPRRVTIGVIGDASYEPVAPRWDVDASVGHGPERGEQVDDGWAERFGFVGADVFQKSAVVSTGDGERAAEPLTNGEHFGHRQPGRPIAHGILVVAEPVGLVVDPQHQFVVAEPVAVRR